MKEHFKETAALIGEPVRATILWTLMEGKALTATELAMAADTTPSNISMHLAKLMNAGLLKATAQGRHRYYALSGKEIAYAVEALATLIPVPSKKREPVDEIMPAIKQCRTCYDHLAGKTGVAIADALLKLKFMVANENSFELKPKGRKWFEGMSIDTDALQEMRRSFLRPCLDWSERRYHIAGSLAAALLDSMLQQDWVRRTKNSRAVIVTAKGQKELYDTLKIVV